MQCGLPRQQEAVANDTCVPCMFTQRINHVFRRYFVASRYSETRLRSFECLGCVVSLARGLIVRHVSRRQHQCCRCGTLVTWATYTSRSVEERCRPFSLDAQPKLFFFLVTGGRIDELQRFKPPVVIKDPLGPAPNPSIPNSQP